MIYDLQKASMLKRISAFVLDVILLCVLAVGVASLMSSLLNYDSYYNTLDACYTKYEEQYGVSFDITEEEYYALEEDARALYDEAANELKADEDVQAAYGMLISLSMTILTISILLAYLGLEFAVPLLFGNGQTVGKKVFAIGVMKSSGVKINTVSLFVRTVLGKFTIETMIPVLIVMMMLWGTIGIVGPIIILGILIIEIVLMITSRTGATIHDTLAQTVTVDIQSQMIFGSESELMDYKKRAHEEMVRKQTY